MSIKRIAAEVGVSPSSVHHWTSDVALTPEQNARNLRVGPQAPELIRARAMAWSSSCRARRARYQLEGRLRAGERDPLHLAGCMLYWAEGSKGKNALEFSNSDPAMVAFFRQFLTEGLSVPVADIRVSLNVYTGNGLSVQAIEQHWLDALLLPASCLRKHTLDHRPTSSSGRAKNKLPYGVCKLRVHSTRLVQQVFGAIQEYGRFDEPTWLA